MPAILQPLIQNRAFMTFAHACIDGWVPPVIRDSKWFCWLLYAPFLKGKAKHFFSFRERTHALTPEQYAEYYRETAGLLGRETDLGPNGFRRLVGDIRGQNVLEVGCGSGHLARALNSHNQMTAVDIVISPNAISSSPDITFVESAAETLPFEDNAFGETVCTHVLEHVQNFEACVAELRRVTRNKLHIIVPLQRPSRFTPDLHISYFPYPESFLTRVRPQADYHYEILDRDLYYVEEYEGQR